MNQVAQEDVRTAAFGRIALKSAKQIIAIRLLRDQRPSGEAKLSRNSPTRANLFLTIFFIMQRS